MIARYARPALLVILIGTLIAVGAEAFAQGVGFSKDKSRGYFFYEPDAVEEETKPETTPKVSPTPAPSKPTEAKKQEPAPFSVAWLRDQMPRVRDLAIDNPTVENITAYRYMQRVMLDKSSKFEESWQQSIVSEPLLDENLRRPISTFGGNTLDASAKKGYEAAARMLASVAGIWFFYRSDCDFCHAQAPVLKALSELYGFKVLPVSLDGKPLPGNEFPSFEVDRGQAEAWGVSMTPALFLVKPSTKERVELAQGLIPLEEIVSRSIRAASNAGWLDQRSVAATRPVRPVYADDKALNAMPKTAADDPAKLSDYLRRELRRQVSLR